MQPLNYLFIRSSVKLLVLLISLSLLAACAGKIKDEDKTEAQLYQDAQVALDKKRYLTAIEKFQFLEARFPFGEFSEASQLGLMYSYYETNKYEEARAAAKRFVRLNSDYQQLDYVLFLSGMAAWSSGRHSLEGLKLTDISSRDPGATKEAYEDFSELIQRFPNSQYAKDAKQRLRYLKNMLAAQEIHAGKFYLRRGAPVAAINRGRYVVEGYRDTPYVADGLALMIEGYLHLEDAEQAQDLIWTLAELDPKHPQLIGRSGFKQLHPANKPEKTLLQILSFDLLKF